MTISTDEIEYSAPPAVRGALERMGRTEDLRFSPSCNRMAIAGYAGSSIAIVSVEITNDGTGPCVSVTDVVSLPSDRLDNPHGVDFLDEDTIIVGNRSGDVVVLGLASAEEGGPLSELTPIDPSPGGEFELLQAPGSVSISRDDDGAIEVVVCNNAGGTVTRHALRGDSDELAVASSEVLLSRWLDIPDGVTISPCGRWIAVSNHSPGVVMVYELGPSLHEDSDPDGILRGASYPHGVRFSADGRHLFVADAGSPYVHLYRQHGETWGGVHNAAASVRVIEDHVFELVARARPDEGGPKGVDIDRSGQVLAVTSESLPLAFFDVSAILERAAGGRSDQSLQFSYELSLLERSQRASRTIASLKRARSYRISQRLRRLKIRWLQIRQR